MEIGKAIEKIQSDRLEEVYEILAYHYSNSENDEKAYQYLKLSGDKAVRNYANNDAFRYYKHAISPRLKNGIIFFSNSLLKDRHGITIALFRTYHFDRYTNSFFSQFVVVFF